jgi:nucleoside-diphosphate-sugar epimerase
VRVLDDFSTGLAENLEPFADRIDLVEGSVVHEADGQRALTGVDYVFHQAALPSVARSVADPLHTHQVNATGTLRLLHQAHQAGVRRFVYAGSSSAYGDTPVLPKREEMTPQPRSPYAVAKLAGEHYVRCFHTVYGTETVVLRYFNVFGPRQDPASQYSAVIAIFLDRALEGRPPTINGDGEQTRDFTFVENVVEANLLACHAPAEAAAGEVFNVGCGERTTVNALWRAIREVAGAPVEAVHGPARPGDVRDSLASLERIQERLGYRPQVSLEEGLRRTLEWFLARRG